MTIPDKDGWTKHTPGPCPVANEFVSIVCTDWHQCSGPSEGFSWGDCGGRTIAFYRIQQPAERVIAYLTDAMLAARKGGAE